MNTRYWYSYEEDAFSWAVCSNFDGKYAISNSYMTDRAIKSLQLINLWGLGFIDAHWFTRICRPVGILDD